MHMLFTFLKERRDRFLTNDLAAHGKVITVIVQESQTQDDSAHATLPELRYLHFISATWTDPQNGKAYLFHHQFRSLREFHCRIGDMVQVRLDPHNYHRYQMQTV